MRTFTLSLAAQAVFRESHDQIQAALDALKRLAAADFAAAREFHKDPDHGKSADPTSPNCVDNSVDLQDTQAQQISIKQAK